MVNSYKYILINGFGWSGSSALVDFMREFDGTLVPNKEFRLIKDPHGLHDLDMAINRSTDALNEDRAINEFVHFIKIYSRRTGGFRPLGLAYCDDFGENFLKISMDFINTITDYVYSGYWWYLDIDKNYFLYILQKIFFKLKLYDYCEHNKLRLTVHTEDEFLDQVKEYINCIFSGIPQNPSTKIIVLDQAIPANRPSWASRYFSNCKNIIVDRDPRDVYIDLIKEQSLVGYDVAIKHDVRLFIDWFKKVRKPDENRAEYKKIQFEELILNYDHTVKEIYDYCELDPMTHIKKKNRLIPENSAKNIGMWKNYRYQEEIKEIENELADYLVQ